MRIALMCVVLALAGAFSHESVLAASPPGKVIERGLEAAAAGRYQDALRTFEALIARAPERPEGHFFRAAVFQLMKGHFDRKPYRRGMEEGASRALALARARIKTHPNDSRSFLIAGLAEGMLAIDAIHNYRYIKALLRGRRMVAHLDRAIALDPDLDDAYYALGVFHVRKSNSPWMKVLALFVEDTSELGIRYLRRAAQGKGWLKTLARVDLVWALYHEERYEEGRRELAQLTSRYPDNPLYRLAYAEGFFIEENYKRAKKEYTLLSHRFKGKSDELSSLYGRFAEWRVVRCNYALGDYKKAEEGARVVLGKPDMNSTLLRQIRLGAASMLTALEKRYSIPRDSFDWRRKQNEIPASPSSKNGKRPLKGGKKRGP